MNIMKWNEKTKLEETIDSALEKMSILPPCSPAYSAIANNVEVLYKAKSNERTKGVSPDTIAIIAGNLLGIALILGYEKANVITTKALGFIIRGRV